MPLEIRDRLGKLHRFDHPPRRVVSLVPSLTESLFDLGAGESVAGVSDFCIFPASAVAALPHLGGTKTPRIDEIRALGPDLVYVNLEENLRRHADAIAEFAPVFATEPKSVADVQALLAQLGAIHGVDAAAARWIEAIRREAAAAAVSARPFSFLCPIWKDPWMWCGGDTYVSDLVSTGGGKNLLAEHARYPRVDLAEALALEPEVIFLPDEPWAFAPEDASALREQSSVRVVGPFPGHLFTWHGTRTAEGLKFIRTS